MYLIGHRGAAGLAPENTLEGIKVAKKHKIDAVEVDIRVTKDAKLILCHDPTLLRKAEETAGIEKLTLKQIQTTVTKSGHPIPTLEEAFEEAGKTRLIIEGKGSNWAKPLSNFLKNQKPKNTPAIISDNHRELVFFSALQPGVETYAISWTHPYDSLYLARQAKLTGVSLHYAHYNFVTYHFAKRAGLKMIMSPINKRWLAKILNKFYPDVAITTDRPDILRR